MTRILGPHQATIYALLRIVAGLMFSLHGFQKVFGLWGFNVPFTPMSQLGLAGILEIVCGLGIALGIYASPLAFLASGEMAVAYFQAHLPDGPWPVTNGGEQAVFYCWFFLYVAAKGAGKWSLRA